jgi:hypothetical protein
MVEMTERAAAWCSNTVARIPWRPSIAKQTEKKKCVHMPYNLQTATMETSPVFYPFPSGIQTQLFSEITSSRSLEMWPSRAGELVIYILRQSPELLYLKACQYFHYNPILGAHHFRVCFETP